MTLLMFRFSVHYFLLFTLMATVVPYFPLLLRARRFSEAQIGHLQGIGAMVGVGVLLLVGYVADRFGKRRGMMMACLAAFILLLAILAGTESLWITSGLVVAIGLIWRPAIPLTDTLASHELADPAHQYGRVRIWGSLGFVLTLLVIRVLGLIDENSAPSITAYMLAAAALCMASSLFLPDRHRAADRHTVSPSEGAGMDWVFWLFLAAAATHQFGMSAYYSFFTLYLKDVCRMENAAWVWALGSAAEIPMLFYAGRIIRRFGLPAMLIVSMAAVSARLAIYALAPVLWVVLPAQALHGLVFGLFHGGSIEFIRRKVPASRRGMAMAAYMSLAIGVPSWLGSSLGGEIIQRWSYEAMYLAYAAVPWIGIACLAAARKSLALAPPPRV